MRWSFVVLLNGNAGRVLSGKRAFLPLARAGAYLGSCSDFVRMRSLRSATEQAEFRMALHNMHTVYTNMNWYVVRLVDIPEDATNNTPYEKRGHFAQTRYF